MSRRVAVATDPKESHPPPRGGSSLAPPRRIIVSRYVLRRLYSTFAGGWPGIGLLLMRLVVGAVVLWHAGPAALERSAVAHRSRYASLALGGTPPHRGVMDASRWSGGRRCRDLRDPHDGEPPVGRLLAATIAGALAMLGPGRLSIDARLFGWKRIDAPVRKK